MGIIAAFGQRAGKHRDRLLDHPDGMFNVIGCCAPRPNILRAMASRAGREI